jgi:hypothetical protein
MNEDVTKMSVRMPGALKKWLESEAARNLPSQASEIVRSVRERKERKEQR